MYDDQAHTDVHLISSEGTVFGVHRVCCVADLFCVQKAHTRVHSRFEFHVGHSSSNVALTTDEKMTRELVLVSFAKIMKEDIKKSPISHVLFKSFSNPSSS